MVDARRCPCGTRTRVLLSCWSLAMARPPAGRVSAATWRRSCGTNTSRAVRVGTDVQATFSDGLRAGPGIVVVAGTGSVVLGATQDGRRLQVGG